MRHPRRRKILMCDARVKKIEERVAWLEHHVTEQDKVMLEQAKRLDRLQAELLRLRESARAHPPGDGEGFGATRAAADERPPHY